MENNNWKSITHTTKNNEWINASYICNNSKLYFSWYILLIITKYPEFFLNVTQMQYIHRKRLLSDLQKFKMPTAELVKSKDLNGKLKVLK